MDEAIFRWVNHWPDSFSGFLVFLSNGIHGLPVKLGLLAIVVGMVAYGCRSRQAIVQALIAFPLANLSADLAKNIMPSTRPCVQWDQVLLHGTDCLTSSGTLSAHAANMAAAATVISLRLGWWGVPWSIFAFLTGLSRMYVGVHSFYQVLGGWIMGAAWGVIVVKVWDLWLKRQSQIKEWQPQESI